MCIDISANEQHMVSGSAEPTVRVWNTETVEEASRFEFDNRFPCVVKFAHDVKLASVASAASVVRFLDFQGS